MNRKPIFKTVLTPFQVQLKKKQLAKMFKEANKEVEMLDLAEAGLCDVLKY